MVNSHGDFHRKCASFIAFFFLILIVSTTGEILKDEDWLLKNEKPCLSQGGLCVVADYCEKSDRANGTALCPEQEPKGVCCHKVPEDASCRWHGGECMEDCGNVENFGQKECPEGKMCCLLI